MAYTPIPFAGSFYDSTTLEPLAGATVTITIKNSAGVSVVSSAACTEMTAEGESFYFYEYTPTTDDSFTGIMSTADPDALQSWLLVGSEASVEIGGGSAPTVEEIWGAPNRTLTSPTLVFDSPFDGNSEDITLIRGDSYSSGDSDRPLQWSGSNWPVLTGGSIALLMRSISAPADVLSFAGSVVNATTARVELTAAQTGAMDVASNRNSPSYEYALVATLADAEVVTLVRGNVTVRRTPTNL